MSEHCFIGLDLAWKIDGNHSGIAVLVGDSHMVHLQAVAEGVVSRVGVLEFIEEHASVHSVLAVDCSLVVRNKMGQRPCETAVAKAFGWCHASCHTTNQRRRYWDTGPKLVQALNRQGFVHDFDLAGAKGRPGRWLFEVYPHPAMVQLFGLNEIIKYKKGLVGGRREGLDKLRGYLLKLPGLQGNSKLAGLLERDLEAVKGKALKRHEDALDALFCAYLAWHCWRWGKEGNDMFGTLKKGYIVGPKGSGSRADAAAPKEVFGDVSSHP